MQKKLQKNIAKIATLMLILFISFLSFNSYIADASGVITSFFISHTSASYPTGSITYCDDLSYICVEPTDPSKNYFDATGTVTYSGFNPTIGIGSPGLGYFSNSSLIASCAATGGTPSVSGYCENGFTANSSGSTTSTASFHVVISPTATRGTIFQVGITANGLTPQEHDFTVQIAKIPPASVCSVSTFTCSTGTLAWSTTNCSGVSIQGPSPSTAVISSPTTTGSTGTSTNPVAIGTYSLIANGLFASSATCNYFPAPALSVSANNVTLTPGATSVNIPFTFSNSGLPGSTVHVNGCRAPLSPAMIDAGFSISGGKPDCLPQDLIGL